MGYKTIKQMRQSEFEEKKSVFISTGKRVFSEEEARAFIEDVKVRYRDARHHVYAYTLGEDMQIQRYSDDGEPQGTGGIPILDVLKRNDLRNCAVVVVRYFGGVLLGSSGLTRAYVRGAVDAVTACGIVEHVEGEAVKLVLEYDLLGKVEHYMREAKHAVMAMDYGEKVEMTVHLEAAQVEPVLAAVVERTAGKAVVQRQRPEFFYKVEGRLLRSLEEETAAR